MAKTPTNPSTQPPNPGPSDADHDAADHDATEHMPVVGTLSRANPAGTPSAPAPMTPHGAREVPIVLTLAASMIVIAGIYFGRDVLLPVSLALLLSFLLAPLMAKLRQFGLPRIVALLASVGLGFGIIAGLLVFVTVQVVELATNLPTYQSNIEQKIESLRTSPDSPVDRLLKLFQRINSKLKGADPSEQGDLVPPETIPESGPPITPLEVFTTAFNSTIGPITTAGIVIVFVLFILQEREEIRNRVVRLLGNRPGQIFITTQALDDAASRVSRYLGMQLIVNVTYGIPIGIGLYFIGVPNPVLWGLLAAMLRFIPYLGPIVASACPIALAFAVDPGWGMMAWTIGLFVVIELISNNIVETLLYGSSTGISSVGILLSAVFWASVWGPIGLLMSTPLTVCFVVLGRYIPAFSFFTMMLSDQPVLPLHGIIYQRLLAMDPDEPEERAQKFLEGHTVEEFYENVMIPLLRTLEAEQAHTVLDPTHRAFILERVRELIEEAAEHPGPKASKSDAKVDFKAEAKGDAKTETRAAAAPAEKDSDETPKIVTAAISSQPPHVVCIPAHDETDELAGLMFTILLNRHGTPARSLSAGMLASERMGQLEALDAPVVLVSALPPFAAFHARHMVKRIRSRFPAMQVVAGLWGPGTPPPDVDQRLKHAGAVQLVWSFKQALEDVDRTPRRQPRPAA